MQAVRTVLSSILLFALPTLPLTAGEPFTVFSYHDVRDTVPLNGRTLTIGSDELVAQFSWLKSHGYQPVSLSDLLAARDGRRALPEKAVLLSFDDGYQSMYSRVFPLLKLYNYPAVLALVSGWMEAKPGTVITYDDEEFKREQLLDWEQVREMEKSGLVEVISHSHQLHGGIGVNPQGNVQAAPAARLYDPVNKRYETDEQYHRRISDDLKRSIQILEQRLGRKPRALAWPYGSYTRDAAAIAEQLGLSVTLTLADGHGDTAHLQTVPRYLIRHGTRLSDFVWRLRSTSAAQPLRVAHVDLDYIYDSDPVQQNKNLGLLIERIKKLEINTVFLQAYADPDGDGNAAALYFPNRHLPMRADLFNHAAHQLRTRALVKVYAWLPVLAYQLPEPHPLAALTVRHDGQQYAAPAHSSYQRLSPFYPEVRKLIGEIYQDLAKHADFDGLLFHDDAYLADYEDSSPAAFEHYQQAWDLPATMAELHDSPATLAAWTKHKTQFLSDFTAELTRQARRYRPDLKTARNLYAAVIMNPAAETWFAQSLPSFIEHYDYAAVMAMPHLENAARPRQWLAELADRVAATPGALPRTLFELQSVDWNTKTPIDSEEIAANMALLRRKGVTHFGYYPDDFVNDHPAVEVIKPEFSLSTNPYRQR